MQLRYLNGNYVESQTKKSLCKCTVLCAEVSRIFPNLKKTAVIASVYQINDTVISEDLAHFVDKHRHKSKVCMLSKSINKNKRMALLGI